MRATGVHSCHCPICREGANEVTRQQHRRINHFLACLNTEQRRWYAAVESERVGRGGDRVISQITGLGEATIQRGRKQLAAALAGETPLRVMERHEGRPLTEVKQPGIEQALERLLEDEVAGDPMMIHKWVRSSFRKLARQLREQGYEVGMCTVGRLLKKMGFSMKSSIKRKRGPISDSPKRDEQFKYIAVQKQKFRTAGLPIISVDTKKSELIGDFGRSGKAWRRDPEEVNTYDFRSLAVCRAIPYGIYDLTKNKGYVFVGTSAATPEFAVDALVAWWTTAGRTTYPDADSLLILADGGGTNGWRSRGWKHQVQTKLCDALRLVVTVCP